MCRLGSVRSCKDTHDLDQVWPNHAVIQNVHRPPHLHLGVVGTCVPQVKAADPAQRLTRSVDFRARGQEDGGDLVGVWNRELQLGFDLFPTVKPHKDCAVLPGCILAAGS
jgi:hypothetical protein